jgi:hypothetical protein
MKLVETSSRCDYLLMTTAAAGIGSGIPASGALVVNVFAGIGSPASGATATTAGIGKVSAAALNGFPALK